jgi:hypothetical protein
MNARKFVPVLLVSLVLIVSGCSTSRGRVAEPTPTPTSIPSPPPMKSVVMYYVGDTPMGFKLFSEVYSFQSSGDLISNALSRLISGRAQPADSNYTNLWGEGTSLNAFTKDGATGVVDLKMGKLNVGAESESRAIDQLLWTLSGIDPSITEILLLVDGQRIESLAGHVDATRPIVKESAFEVLSPLQISSITDGEELNNPVVISGEACTFEANVVWTLRKDNVVMKSEPTTATSACPDRGTWEVKLGDLEPGNYSFTVEDFSAKDGSLAARDDKKFSIATRQ